MFSSELLYKCKQSNLAILRGRWADLIKVNVVAYSAKAVSLGPQPHFSSVKQTTKPIAAPFLVLCLWKAAQV